MAESLKITWDDVGKKLYETGTDRGVLYKPDVSGVYNTGFAWNGLTGVKESPTGAEETALYADNIKYLALRSTEEYGATIEAFTYPEEFEECDGSALLGVGVVIGQQKRKMFGFSYRTILGNDLENNDYGYKLHLVYGATASPSAKEYATTNETPEAVKLSWEIKSTPVQVTGFKPTASVTIDSTKVDAAKLAALEMILYGTDTVAPRLPMPDEIKTLLTAA